MSTVNWKSRAQKKKITQIIRVLHVLLVAQITIGRMELQRTRLRFFVNCSYCRGIPAVVFFHRGRLRAYVPQGRGDVLQQCGSGNVSVYSIASNRERAVQSQRTACKALFVIIRSRSVILPVSPNRCGIYPRPVWYTSGDSNFCRTGISRSGSTVTTFCRTRNTCETACRRVCWWKRDAYSHSSCSPTRITDRREKIFTKKNWFWKFLKLWSRFVENFVPLIHISIFIILTCQYSDYINLVISFDR